MLRKKHQEVVVDFQDQIDQLSKSRAKYVNRPVSFVKKSLLSQPTKFSLDNPIVKKNLLARYSANIKLCVKIFSCIQTANVLSTIFR